jgi:predicted dienelactone hydrolase
MKRLALAALFLFSAAGAVRAETAVGIEDLTVPDAAHRLHGYVWYPAQPGGTPTLVGDTRLWVGSPAVRDAKPADGAFPLVVLSHGLGGNALNLDWLAPTLAAHGMIVAAINHPGTTSGDLDPRALGTIWTRPDDISRTITALLADPGFGPRIDAHRIAVVGHSLGGYTALAVAGVRLARGRMGAHCADHGDEGCDVPVVRKARLVVPDDRYEASHRDPRVAAVVAMAPGLTPAMTADSIAAIAVPVLLVAGAHDATIPIAHLRALAAGLPASAAFAELPDGNHYDFVAVCKPGGAAFLRATGDDEPVCDTATDRAALHAGVAARIVGFLGDQGF